MATLRAEVANVATPEAFVNPVPRVLGPSLNVTVSPAGTVPTPGELTVTVAVNVTDWPNTDGFVADVKAVAVGAGFTTCETALEVLVAKFVSPAYAAVMGCVATLSDEVVNVATPDALVVPVPIVVPLSLNVTVSAAGIVPVEGALTVTAAVKVTDCPNTDGFTDEVSTVVVGAWFTVCEKAFGVELALKKLSPP